MPDTDAVLITEEGGFGQDVLLCRGTVVFYLRYYGDQELSAHPELLAELAQFDGSWVLGGLSALRRVGRTGPLFRPLRPVVSWGLERVFDFSRSFPYNEAARRRTVWTG